MSRHFTSPHFTWRFFLHFFCDFLQFQWILAPETEDLGGRFSMEFRFKCENIDFVKIIVFRKEYCYFQGSELRKIGKKIVQKSMQKSMRKSTFKKNAKNWLRARISALLAAFGAARGGPKSVQKTIPEKAALERRKLVQKTSQEGLPPPQNC